MTIYGCTTGISGTAAAYSGDFINITISGCTTGASWVSAVNTNEWIRCNWFDNDTDVVNVTKGGDNLAVDPQFVCLLAGDDLAHGNGAGATVTSAGAGFVPCMVGDNFYIVEAGDGADSFVMGTYTVASWVSTTEISLDRDPTSADGIGANGDFRSNDFSIAPGSNLDDQAFKLRLGFGE